MYFAVGTPRILTERTLSAFIAPSRSAAAARTPAPADAAPSAPAAAASTDSDDSDKDDKDAVAHKDASESDGNIDTKKGRPTDSSSPRKPPQPQSPAACPSLLAARRCPNLPLFATITYSSVSIWSIRPDTLLSKVTRSSDTITEDGENVDLVWRPDGSQLVVLTNEGFLHFYDVVELDQPLYDYNFKTTHHHASGPGETKAVLNRILRFRMALEVDSGTQCGIGLDDELLVCTNSPPSILSLSWNGEVNIHGTIPLSGLQFLLDAKDPIAQIDMHRERGIFGFVSLEGRAYIARRISDGTSRSAVESESRKMDQWTGYCFYGATGEDVPATTIAFNPTFTLVAVGNLQGVANLYSLDYDVVDGGVIGGISNTNGGVTVPTILSHVMAITKPGDAKTPIRLSATAALSWTSDGYALAVAWVYGGMSVWSVFGSLLMSTVSEDTFVHSSAGIVDNTNEIFFTGTQDLFWDTSGHDLFVLPSSPYDRDPVTDMYVLQFAKASILTCDSWSNSRHVCLLLDDRLLMYEGLNSDVDATSLDPLNWETIPVPNVYLAENWPIRYVSINTTGHFIAVAGKRGLAHYNTLSAKWKLFGSEQQEQGFSVQGGMLWFRTMLIIACQDLAARTSEIRVFSRETKLDNSCILHIERLQYPVLCMNNTDSHLLLYCADHVVRYYSIHVAANGRRLQFHPHQAFSMQELVGGWGNVQAIARFPPMGEISTVTMSNNPFVILRNGGLHMVSKRGDAWEAIQVATHTEHFWISAHEDEVEEFSNTMWAFSGANIKILTNIIVDPVTGVDNTFLDAALDITVDFYPLTVLIQKGLFVGIEKRITLNASLDVSQFGTDAKSHLFLHFILRHLLMLGLEAKAIKFSSNYESLEYFGHALEVLLHRALEEDVDQKRAGDSVGNGIDTNIGDGVADTLLARAVRFIQRFPKSLEIIVNCARKSEMALWAHFFSVVGDPKAMFQQSLDAGFLTTATSYLIIIQTLETSLSTSSRLAVQLLEKAFELRDYETGSELVRFLRTIDEGENPNGYVDGVVGSERRYSISSSASASASHGGVVATHRVSESGGNVSVAASDGTLPPKPPTTSTTKTTDVATTRISATQIDADTTPDMFYFDLLVNNHAKTILTMQQFRDLGRYATLFQLNLADWLRREQDRTRDLITDWFETFLALHDQFGWAMPNDFVVAAVAAGGGVTATGVGKRGSFTQQMLHGGQDTGGDVAATAHDSTGVTDPTQASSNTTNNASPPSHRKARKPSLRTHSLQHRPPPSHHGVPTTLITTKTTAAAATTTTTTTSSLTTITTTTTTTTITLNRKQEELRHLYRSATVGGFHQLAVLLGAMLLDSQGIIDVFDSGDPSCSSTYHDALRDALMRTKCRGYKQLARHLDYVGVGWRSGS